MRISMKLEKKSISFLEKFKQKFSWKYKKNWLITPLTRFFLESARKLFKPKNQRPTIKNQYHQVFKQKKGRFFSIKKRNSKGKIYFIETDNPNKKQSRAFIHAHSLAKDQFNYLLDRFYKTSITWRNSQNKKRTFASSMRTYIDKNIINCNLDYAPRIGGIIYYKSALRAAKMRLKWSEIKEIK